MFHSFFPSLRSRNLRKWNKRQALVCRFVCFDFHSIVHLDSQIHDTADFLSLFILFYLFIYLFIFFWLIIPYLVFWPGLFNLFVSQNPREFCEPDSSVCIYHSVVWGNLNFLHNYQTFITRSCIVLYFYDILLICDSSFFFLLPHILHLLFYFIISISLLWHCFVFL